MSQERCVQLDAPLSTPKTCTQLHQPAPRKRRRDDSATETNVPRPRAEILLVGAASTSTRIASNQGRRRVVGAGTRREEWSRTMVRAPPFPRGRSSIVMYRRRNLARPAILPRPRVGQDAITSRQRAAPGSPTAASASPKGARENVIAVRRRTTRKSSGRSTEKVRKEIGEVDARCIAGAVGV